ncbi:uncharacterized protein FOMMEDRAFT_168671 [Fomitiporia mediterranea MF3/22]|uniref:uncharacterized protein n=1 Tax=Fomitiporia mediterranea (strain MF3/22) TaxID=694068 RepID=UPI000440843E|nr:uncharacterized protein FOMMEDRAFT_168671 [Fomitiporia mediterranea MF3/22]EJD02139.1 hypothetical protein FOMMEDRAFT_168671 [Fomitiporia mediterranea MF3/22]
MPFRQSLLKGCLFIYVLSCAAISCEARPATFNNGTSFIFSNESGTVQITDPVMGNAIAQGSANDGAGNGINVPALLWIVFAFLLGIPLLTAGVRLGRFTSGVGLGLGIAVSIWASIINTASEGNIADMVILAITVALFVIGFVIGVVTIEYRVGTAVLGAAGGLSIMMRIILMKEDLLVGVYYVDWLLCAVFGAVGLVIVVWKERWGVIVGSSAAGSFLICLGIDLLINKQAGMSRGLRFMFDRNSHHLSDIFGTGYKPLISSQIIMIITIAVIPIFAYAQHKFFPRPFRVSRHRPSSFLGDDASIRSRTWIGRIRGRKHSPIPPSADPNSDKNASTQALVTNVDVPNSPGGMGGKYRDEPPHKEEVLQAAGVPTLQFTQH